MILPNFLCVGAQKAGTTTLHEILAQHPEIFLPEIKETHFFFKEDKYQKGLSHYSKTYFKNWKGEKAVGEVDPGYMYFPFVPERIYKDLGKDIKILILLRNPVDRAYSQYLMNVRRSLETKSFEEAIESEKERIKEGFFNFRMFGYVERSLYLKQIKRLLKFFPVENMFFIIFETEFLNKREETIKKVFDFLNISTNVEVNVNIKSNPASLPRFKIVNDFLYSDNFLKKIGRILIPDYITRRKIMHKINVFNRKKGKIKPLDGEIKRKLFLKYFEKDIFELEKILNRDLSCWYKEVN